MELLHLVFDPAVDCFPVKTLPAGEAFIRNFFETAPVIYGLSANSDSVNRVQILNQSLVIQVGSKHRIHETVLPLAPGADALGWVFWMGMKRNGCRP